MFENIAECGYLSLCHWQPHTSGQSNHSIAAPYTRGMRELKIGGHGGSETVHIDEEGVVALYAVQGDKGNIGHLFA